MSDLKTDENGPGASQGQLSSSVKRKADTQDDQYGHSVKKLQGPTHLEAQDVDALQLQHPSNGAHPQLTVPPVNHTQDATIADNGTVSTAQTRQQDFHVPALVQVRVHNIKMTRRKGRRSLVVTIQVPAKELGKLPLRPCQQPDVPDPSGRCFFLAVPREIRDEIYSHLLRADALGPRPGTVHLLHAWDRVYPRWRRGLHIDIILACRQTAAEGLRTLYEENTFRYLVRDTQQQQVRRLTLPGSVKPGLIDTAQLGHRFRHLGLMIESNRFSTADDAVSSALEMLSAPRTAFPNLNTVTMSIVYHPTRQQDNSQLIRDLLYLFSRGGRLVKAIKALHCNTFDLVIHHGGPQREAPVESWVMPWRPLVAPRQISVGARFQIRYLRERAPTDAFLRYVWMMRRAEVYGRLSSLRWRVEGATYDPHRAIELGIWERRPHPF